MNHRSPARLTSISLLLPFALAACGGGGLTTVGGTVTGLNAGTAVTLQNNGGDTLVVGAIGSFTFAPQYNAGSTYNVTIAVQPAGLACTVTNGTGRIDDNASKVTNIGVSCVPGLTIRGNLTGLASGNTVVLQNNDADPISLTTNSTFNFPRLLVSGATYNVTVRTQPTTPVQTCTVSQGTGTVGNSDVLNVAVACN